MKPTIPGDTKLGQIHTLWAQGDRIGALRIAARFTDPSPETTLFQRGWLAHTHPDFFRQLRRDPDVILADALAMLAAKFKLDDGHARSS